MITPARLLEDLRKKGTAGLSGVTAEAAALVASRLPDSGKLIVVTPDAASADRFAR